MDTNTARTLSRSLNGIAIPDGETIQFKDGRPVTPTNPIIPFIEGDGIGAEISGVTRTIIDRAVALAYCGKRKIAWFEVLAGDNAVTATGEPLPADTLTAIQEFGVAIKGPLNTPTGGGMRSLNVALRKHFDLYRCVRPVRWYQGVPSPVVRPQDLDVVIFRENTEDVYSGIDFEMGTPEAERIIALLAELGAEVRKDSGIGVKPISRHCSRRLVRSAIQYAIDHGRKTVTLVHKGNIQKYTEGAFRQWGYEVAREEFGDIIVTEDEYWNKYQGKLPEGKILLNDRIADNMFADALLRPSRYSVIATPNLNGDYLSDATAAQVGGLGIAPGANLGDTHAIFEATHGTAPDIAGKNLANPCSLLLSAVMMLEYIGWDEAAARVVAAIEKTIAAKTVTGDLARLMTDATALGTDKFADAIVANMGEDGGNSGHTPDSGTPDTSGPAASSNGANSTALAVASSVSLRADSGAAPQVESNSNETAAKSSNWRRYFTRELLPRTVLFTALFKWAMPVLSFGLLRFSQGLEAAMAFAVIFTAFFWVVGSLIMGSAEAQDMLKRNSSKWWFVPANLLVVLGAPVLALWLASVAAPGTFGAHGLLGLLLGSVFLNVACAATHDWGNK